MKKGFLIKSIILVIIFLLISSNVKSFNTENEEDEINNCAGNHPEPFTDEEIATIQKQAEAEGWSFNVGQTAANQRSMDELCGLVVPEELQENVDNVKDDDKPLSVGNSGLPSRFNWDEEISGGLPPVRDQGQCGSCWAFATMGPIEINIKMSSGSNVDCTSSCY